MKFSKKKRTPLIVIALSAIAMTLIIILIVQLSPRKPNNNPWDYTLFTFKTDNSLISQSDNLDIIGHIRSNGGMVLSGETVNISGFAIAGSAVSTDVQSFSVGEIQEVVGQLSYNNIFDNLHITAGGSANYFDGNIFDSFVCIDEHVISDSPLTINVSANVQPKVSETRQNARNKFGAFGAEFLVSVYENLSDWNNVLPIFHMETLSNTEETVLQDFFELAEKSSFIPIREQIVYDFMERENFESLPGTVFQNHFNPKYVTEYIDSIKKGNPVFSVGKSNTVAIDVNSETNPHETFNATSLSITGGNFTLDGNYEKLEEIKLDNWGGVQLIGNFPKLKYIYKTSLSPLNLAGNFSSLEFVYTSGGQLLLGSGDNGFKADNSYIINENGNVIIYTAKNMTITNSSVITNQNITIRGAGKNANKSKFNAENSLFASNNGLSFEDMNDDNTTRYIDIPVFYSHIPLSFVNCNIELLQGAFISKNGALVLTESDIEILRGFLFAPQGISGQALNSSISVSIDVQAYNTDPNVNILNKQQSGNWNIGGISKLETANFPVELSGHIGNIAAFIKEIQSVGDTEYVVGDENSNPGVFTLNSYLLSESDLNISSDFLEGGEKSKSVIASRNGDITINSSGIGFNGIIYAPNGKVTIVGTGVINGRIFAQEIEIISDSLVINGGKDDISDLGFSVS